MATTPLENSITVTQMKGTKELVQISLMTAEIRRANKHLVGIANSFKADTENRMEPTIQPTTVDFKQVIGTAHIVIGTTSPLGFLVVVFMFPYPGGIMITKLG